LRHRPAGLTLLARDRFAPSRAQGARSWFTFPTHLHLSVHPTTERRVGMPPRAAEPDRPPLVASALVLRHRSASTPGRFAAPAPLPDAATGRSRPISRREVAPVPLRPVRRVEPPSAPSPAAERVRVPIWRRAAELAVRVVQGKRRVELPPARPAAVVHEGGATAAGPRAGDEPAGRPAERPEPGARRPHRPGAAEPATPLDLERLTDRIVDRLDARLVAHRERFGRAF
jgi:hypothetical protein